ncbi:MAG: GumC family protein, partial [Devosia sp.]
MYVSEASDRSESRAAGRGLLRRDAPDAGAPRGPATRQWTPPRGGLSPVDAAQVLAWLRGALWLIVALAMVGMIAGMAFGTLAKPRYTATVDILVDPGNLQVVADDPIPQAQQSDAQLLAVESRLRVLTARATLADVVAALHLDQDPEFVPPSNALPFGSLFGNGAGVPEDAATTALRSLAQRVSAGREQLSYVVTLSVWTSDPQKSVNVANAVTVAFKDELAKSEADAIGQAATALDDRLNALKTSAAAAAEKVDAFKRAHNLVEAGGQLTSTISMTQLNTQLLDARAKLNDAQAHYQQLVAGGAAAANAEALDSTTMSALRTQYSTLKQQVDSLSQTLGPRHPTLVALKSQLVAAQQQIDRETARIVQAAKQQVDQAQAALAALQKQAAAASATVFKDNAAQVELDQLQRDANTAATLYETFLSRARAVSQRQQIDTTNIRVISPPLLPDSRSYPPRTVLLVAAGLLAGAAAGAGIGVGVG